ncbi:MAG TPA: hypothetical protein VMX16_06130 [Terriglobia bacterium]|nr:hypothetical protein [Terriglobia bacterium]
MRKQAILVLIASLALAWPLAGQKIEVQPRSETTITRVETALNHLTVIQLAEPVLAVAAGSQAFKVEWRGNKVFIEPTEANASTNLFIWTKSGRLIYELEPAGRVAQMDFAVDQRKIDPPVPKPVPATHSAAQAAVDNAFLLGGQPVRITSFKTEKNRVQLLIKDLFQYHDRLYIRYVIVNSTKRVYETGKPEVFCLTAPRGPMQILDRRGSQLTRGEAKQIASTGQTPVEVMDQDMRARKVGPDQQAVGVVGLKMPHASDTPRVFRIVLPANGHEQVETLLVL